MGTLGRLFGMSRQQGSYTNVLACRPPGNDLDGFLYRLTKENKLIELENEDRALSGLPPRPLIPSPVECCWPRLYGELRRYTRIIALGAIAARYVADERGGIMGARGAYREVTLLLPEEGGEHRMAVVPVLHPAFVLRSPKWSDVFWWDLVRAHRWWTGTIQWTPPAIIRNPSPRDLAAFLWSGKPFFAWDVETDDKESLTANLRVIGVGTADTVMVVHILSVDGHTRFYPETQLLQLADIFRRWFADPNVVKVGHNSLSYDTTNIWARMGVWTQNQRDTILYHKHFASELPHNLEFVITSLQDAPKWKTDREGRKRSTKTESDAELGTYNAYDVQGVARVFPGLERAVAQRGQAEVCSKDHRLLLAGAQMHVNGMFILQDKRRAWEKKLRIKFAKAEREIREILDAPKLNILSTAQLGEVLFKHHRIAPLRFTPRGAAALDDDAIRAMIVAPSTPRSPERDAERKAGKKENLSKPDLIDALLCLRSARRAQKYLGTYIVRLRPASEVCTDDYLWEDEDEDLETQIERRAKKDNKPGLVLADGRVHPTWNLLATSGRYNSAGPNLQNIPLRLKDIFGAYPGNVLVGVDADQLENRVAAARWGEERYLRVFRRALVPGTPPWECDPHIETMRMVFGEERVLAFTGQPDAKSPKGSKTFKRARDLGKRVAYASAYGANSQTVWEVITSAEDDDDNLIYADLPLAEVVAMHENWLKNCAAYPAGWQREVATWLAQGYLTEPIWGRRRDFLDSTRDKPDRNELCNFPIQGSGIAIVNDALFELLDAIPHARWGHGTGFVQHGHDALIFEVPAHYAEEARALQNRAMNRRYDVYDVIFSGESASGPTWKDT